MRNSYRGECFILTTKHAKSVAIAPQLWSRLNVSLLECPLDTDSLGTFSGEVERQGNALECARRKCELGMNHVGERAKFGLASEGSFGPHPQIPFLAIDQEILYFIDRKRGFHLHVSHSSQKTNYQMGAIDSIDALFAFAKTALFPSHGLIVRPNDRKKPEMIFKGIVTEETLIAAFNSSAQHSEDKRAWVETDMRAHFNPTRMNVICQLTDKFIKRLTAFCPACKSPGWGMVGVKKGLLCEHCDQETDMIAYEIDGCVKCPHISNRIRSDGIRNAPAAHCNWCNP